MYKTIIVEDDPMVSSINKQYVEATEGFKVIKTFKNGLEALEYLGNHIIDLIILDYYMPGITGQEFIDHLHSMGRAPAIIMVTSANDPQIIRSLIRRGVVDYLVKPFEFSRFKSALERFASTRAMLSANKSLDQSSIDQLINASSGGSNTPAPLAKGLNEATLEKIRTFMSENPNENYTSEQVAERTNLSRITVRRYMNHLVETNVLLSTIDYKTGGRPSIKYMWKE